MIQAVGAIGSYSDPEYLKIIQALIKLGITPSGNKQIDKVKLEEAEAKLKEKVQKAQRNNEDTHTPERTKMEEERKGATLLAEINKVLMGLYVKVS